MQLKKQGRYIILKRRICAFKIRADFENKERQRCIVDFTMVIPVLIAFVLSVAAGPVVIPVLRRLKMDQTEREDGVKSHLKKAGTPTMGA